jgi:hypothetical protein
MNPFALLMHSYLSCPETFDRQLAVESSDWLELKLDQDRALISPE